ncbi:Ribosomal RNA large subunit methyltransferase j, partial [Globisporangium splendens]
MGLDEAQMQRRRQQRTQRAAATNNVALSPCVAIHTEETQLQRFAGRLAALQFAENHASVAIVAIESPLIYARLQPVDSLASNRDLMHSVAASNAMLRARIETAFGSGRIHAHRVYQLDWSCVDPEWIPMAAPLLELKPTSIFRVMAFPKQLQDKITALLHGHGYATHPKQYTHELYVTLQPLLSPYFHFGVAFQDAAHAKGEEIVDGEDGPRVMSFAADAPCRAYFKMEESLRYVTLRSGDRVIDVGASPGGWTECLVANGAHVVAVDPGELTIDMVGKPIVHLQMLLEAAKPQLEQLGPFAMCVCDINIRVHAMAELMLNISHLLRPNAPVVFTLKLGKKPSELAINEAFSTAKTILSSQFRDFQLRWLHANTQNERTLFAIKK